MDVSDKIEKREQNHFLCILGFSRIRLYDLERCVNTEALHGGELKKPLLVVRKTIISRSIWLFSMKKAIRFLIESSQIDGDFKYRLKCL